MSNCLNFIDQETLIKTNVCKMGERRDHIIIDRTPKCHPNISGEGVVYSWFFENNYHRQLSLDKKKGEKNP